MRRRARMTYSMSPAARVMAGIISVVGGIFVLIGIFIVIPASGVVGIIWTLFSAGITVLNAGAALGKKRAGPEIVIEEEPASSAGGSGSAEDRLSELRSLYDRGLISPEEYEKKREEIISEL